MPAAAARPRRRSSWATAAAARCPSELVEHLFLPAYGDDGGVGLAQLGDAAVLGSAARGIAMSTDSFVVRPRFFPGGNIGDLAVNGTVNDVAMSRRPPLRLSVGMRARGGPRSSTSSAASPRRWAAPRDAPGCGIVTGDTKVVDSGSRRRRLHHTTGIGVVARGRRPRPAPRAARATP